MIGKGDLLGVANEVSKNKADTAKSNNTMACSTNLLRIAPTMLFHVR